MLPALPTALFVAFTLLATAGAFLVGRHFRGPAVGVTAAALVLGFMTALYAYVTWLLRTAGM